jgi:hypothetical protein
MLVNFQQAFVDLVASPEFCVAVRSRPQVLRERYKLSDSEWDRLVEMVNHPGMACNCMLYRANRVAPLALNLPDLCRVLGKQLRSLLSAYWTQYPNPNVHFLRESERFCQFIHAQLKTNSGLSKGIAGVLEREWAALRKRSL